MSDAATGPTRDPADAATDRPRGGIDIFDSLLVRQLVRAGETGAVRDLIAE
jgi:hypothetical protein